MSFQIGRRGIGWALISASFACVACGSSYEPTAAAGEPKQDEAAENPVAADVDTASDGGSGDGSDTPNDAADPQGGSAENGGAGSAGEMDTQDEADTTAPEIVSVSPPSGATGVTADTKIVVTFSEPMHRRSVELAFGSSELAVGAGFSWDDASTVLTVTPATPLEYATGTNFSVVAKTYGVTVGTTACDAAGNPLSEALSSSFSTLRRVKRTTIASATGMVASDGAPNTSALVGDDSENNSFRAFLTFEWSAVSTATVESATLRINALGYLNDPFAALGTLEVDHVYNATLSTAAYDAAPLAYVGAIASQYIEEYAAIDVTEALRNDLENRDARGQTSQYRLYFAKGTNSDHVSQLIYLGDAENDAALEPRPALAVTFLAP